MAGRNPLTEKPKLTTKTLGHKELHKLRARVASLNCQKTKNFTWMDKIDRIGNQLGSRASLEPRTNNCFQRKAAKNAENAKADNRRTADLAAVISYCHSPMSEAG
jgi:hypothetical protein